MAVNLLGANDAKITTTDPGIHGGTQYTFAITFKASAGIANGRRLFGQWGSSTTEQSFLISIANTDEILLSIRAADSTYRECSTTGLNLVTGTWYRCCFNFSAAGSAFGMYVNGANFADTPGGAGTVNSLNNATAEMFIGRETDENIDGVDGDYAEVAIWNTALTETQCLSYSNGNSPCHFAAANLQFYSRLTSSTVLTDEGLLGLTLTNTAGTDATHPAVTYCGGSPGGGGGQGGGKGKGGGNGGGGGGGGGNPGGGPPGQGGGNGKPDRFFVANRRERRVVDF